MQIIQKNVDKILTEDTLELMYHIEKDSKISQRELAKAIGISIGKVNYCLKALIDIGFVKLKNFSDSGKKSEYAYIITPRGIKEKIRITKMFIKKKQEEYEKLASFIEK